jgi:hypothetical protein
MKFSIDRIFDIRNLVKELATGLKRLDFVNNFESFQTSEITIAANTEESIRNELDSIPNSMIILKQTGNALVTAGDTTWTSNFLYVKNHDASNSATVKILFIK